MKTPAHKNTTNPPGQIVNPIPKQECEKRTFNEWLDIYYPFSERPTNFEFTYWYSMMKDAWKAAQENK